MSTTAIPKTPQGPVPALGVPDVQDYARLVFTAPYFETVALAELIEPAVTESVESQLPGLLPPYVQDAANIAVAQQAVLLAGSTMTGPLFLNPTLPTQPSQAASMAYVDLMVSTAGVPEVPAVPIGQSWARQTGQWVPIDPEGGTFLPLGGGTMQGQINMSGNSITNLPSVPQLPNGAAPAQWVLNQIAAQSLYQGTWDADTNAPDLTLPGNHQNGFTWFAITTAPGGVVISWPIPGLQGLTVFNGDTIIYSAIAGQFQAIHAGGLTLPEAQSLFLQLSGGQMSGGLLLNANATSSMQATTLQQVQALVATAGLGEAPTDGQLYGRSGATQSWLPSLPLAGGILTGALTLAGNAVQLLNPVPLQQLNTSLANYVPLAGGATMTGPLAMGSAATLTLNANATLPLQAVPFQQLTSVLASYVPLTGNVTMTGPLTLSGNATTALQSAPLQQVQAVSGENVGRNLLHNGLFNIQQRGVGSWTTAGYTADRWELNLAGDTVNVAMVGQTDAGRTEIGDEASQWLLSNGFTGLAGAANYNLVYQPIENVRRLAGKTVTVSFWAIATAGLRLGIGITQNFGSGGTPSTPVAVNGQSVPVSGNWARYSLTFVVPSAAGMTFGTTPGTDYTRLEFWYSAGSNWAVRAGNIGTQAGTINLWGVQLEIGSTATPLEKLDPQLDLANCQRFYQTSAFQIGGSNVSAGGFTPTSIPLGTHMRATPTVLIASVSYSNASGLTIGGNTSASIISSSIVITAAGGWLASGNWTASADL